jgi:hypothetical protein
LNVALNTVKQRNKHIWNRTWPSILQYIDKHDNVYMHIKKIQLFLEMIWNILKTPKDLQLYKLFKKQTHISKVIISLSFLWYIVYYCVLLKCLVFKFYCLTSQNLHVISWINTRLFREEIIFNDKFSYHACRLIIDIIVCKDQMISSLNNRVLIQDIACRFCDVKQ